MPYLNQYRFSYKQKMAGTPSTVQVTIYQKSSDGVGTPVITELTAKPPGLVISIVDNDKDKFKPVRGKQASLTFLPQTGVTASTFSTGPDDEWIVEAIVVETSYILFKGFLVMDDHQQPFLPISHKYDIELTATDNLGTLSEVPLTDDSGNYIRGKKKIIEVIAQCLRKTNMELDIIVNDSWMEESQTTFSPACDVIYLDMKTFENKPNEAVSCLEALEIIFGYRLSLKQKNGAWWVENIDEKTGSNVYAFRFDSDGVFVSQLTTTTSNQSIGKTQALKLINKDAIVSYTRPKKFTKLTYRYELPEEVVDNMDFNRGAVNAAITVPSGYTAYDLDDWTKGAGSRPNPFTSSITADQLAYIVRKHENGYEKERFMVLEKSTYDYNTQVYWVRNTNPIPVGDLDKLVISLDWQMYSDLIGAGVSYVGMYALLVGDNGTTYIYWGNGLHYNGSRWWPLTVVSFPDDRLAIKTEFERNTTNETEWQTMSGELQPCPVSGELYLYIPLPEIPGVTKIKFANLQVDYIPYINGSYQRYSGHSNTISQAGNYKANIDDRVYLGDSPRKIFKGAMFKLVAGKYVLTERWFAGGDLLNGALVPPYPPGDGYLHPFGWLQAYAVWNQYRRRMIGLQGSVKGLRLDTTSVPELTDNYQIDANVAEANNKFFMLVGMEQDPESDTWSATLEETNDTVEGKDYTSPLEYKYEGGIE